MTAHLHLASGNGAANSRRLPVEHVSIVLADDHALVRRNLLRLLDGEPEIEVVGEAADLDTAVRLVHQHEPQVLVIDLQLPGGSSIEMLRRLRAQLPGTDLVVLTMEHSPAFAQRALDVGALGFVLMDRADAELPDAVRRAARGEEFISPGVEARLHELRQVAHSDGLTLRETEVLRLIALGFTSREIADKLQLSRRTVETHRTAIHRKLGLTKRSELVKFALRRELVHG